MMSGKLWIGRPKAHWATPLSPIGLGWLSSVLQWLEGWVIRSREIGCKSSPGPKLLGDSGLITLPQPQPPGVGLGWSGEPKKEAGESELLEGRMA